MSQDQSLLNQTDPRATWEQRYRRFGATTSRQPYHAWLEQIQPVKDLALNSWVLDLGCGQGFESRNLCAMGFHVVAVDFARQAVQIAKQKAPHVRAAQVDFRDGLPFVDDSFQLAVANLTLHYFLRQQTADILCDIWRCLGNGGLFIGRFNSINDVNFGAKQTETLRKNYGMVNGVFKRFFDRQSLEEHFSEGWRIQQLEEKAVRRYGKSKMLWEIVAKNN